MFPSTAGGGPRKVLDVAAGQGRRFAGSRHVTDCARGSLVDAAGCSYPYDAALSWVRRGRGHLQAPRRRAGQWVNGFRRARRVRDRRRADPQRPGVEQQVADVVVPGSRSGSCESARSGRAGPSRRSAPTRCPNPARHDASTCATRASRALGVGVIGEKRVKRWRGRRKVSPPSLPTQRRPRGRRAARRSVVVAGARCAHRAEGPPPVAGRSHHAESRVPTQSALSGRERAHAGRTPRRV